MAARLSEEHSRHSTTCSKNDFALATSSAFPPSEKPLCSLDVTTTGREISKYYHRPQEVTAAHKAWQRLVNVDPGTFDPEAAGRRKHVLYPLLGTDGIRWTWDGVAVKQKRPELRSWRFTFQQEPRVMCCPLQDAQQPTPALSDARHRPGVP
ncbi:uncharacterized protein LOC101854857 [Aplysia californica]|uniref:Uncharacterized protein LOC101854857 n=1 Tax=Aplysia californica TaxID=6500 RepID=A0ABM0JJG9_APLCA|nr:uncharacterized protein LOC101854857 [Aplysia californica]